MIRTAVLCVAGSAAGRDRAAAADELRARGDYTGLLVHLSGDLADSPSKEFSHWLRAAKIVHGVYGQSDSGPTSRVDGVRLGRWRLWPSASVGVGWSDNIERDADDEDPITGTAAVLAPALTLRYRKEGVRLFSNTWAATIHHADDDPKTHDRIRVYSRLLVEWDLGAVVLRFNGSGRYEQPFRQPNALDFRGLFGAEVAYETSTVDFRFGGAADVRANGTATAVPDAAGAVVGLSVTVALRYRLAIVADMRIDSLEYDRPADVAGADRFRVGYRFGLMASVPPFSFLARPALIRVRDEANKETVVGGDVEAAVAAGDARIAIGFGRDAQSSTVPGFWIGIGPYLSVEWRPDPFDLRVRADHRDRSWAEFDPASADPTSTVFVSHRQRRDRLVTARAELGFAPHRFVRLAAMYSLGASFTNYTWTANLEQPDGSVEQVRDDLAYIVQSANLMVQLRY